MIGYVLLISAMIVMWFVVFQWLKTYVPKETPECPEDVSVIIVEVSCANNILTIDKLKNNGLFSVNGFILKGEVSEEGIGAIVDAGSREISDGNYPFPGESELEPGGEKNNLYFSGDNSGKDYIITSIELTPVRIQEDENGKKIPVVCTDAKVKKEISDCILKLND